MRSWDRARGPMLPRKRRAPTHSMSPEKRKVFLVQKMCWASLKICLHVARSPVAISLLNMPDVSHPLIECSRGAGLDIFPREFLEIVRKKKTLTGRIGDYLEAEKKKTR